jgi:hypothetical protein
MLQDAYTTLKINLDSTDKQREEAWTALGFLNQGDMGGPPQFECHINAVDDSIQAEIDHQRSRAAAQRNRARNLRTQRYDYTRQVLEWQAHTMAKLNDPNATPTTHELKGAFNDVYNNLAHAETQLRRLNEQVMVPINPITADDTDDAKYIEADKVYDASRKNWLGTTQLIDGFRATVDTLTANIEGRIQQASQPQASSEGQQSQIPGRPETQRGEEDLENAKFTTAGLRTTIFQYGEQEAKLNEQVKKLEEQIRKNCDHIFISQQDAQDYYNMTSLNREMESIS